MRALCSFGNRRGDSSLGRVATSLSVHRLIMTETTEFEDELSREEVANYLRSIADEFEDGETATVRMGNKQVALQPGSTIRCNGEITERGGLLSSNREELSIALSWKPEKN